MREPVRYTTNTSHKKSCPTATDQIKIKNKKGLQKNIWTLIGDLRERSSLQITLIFHDSTTWIGLPDKNLNGNGVPVVTEASREDI